VIVIRTADPADLDALASLERAVFGNDAWSPRSLEQELEALGDHRHLLVATTASGIVGYAAAANDGETCDLLRMVVAPDHRREGIASSLFAGLFPAGRQPYDRILLEVAEGNRAALALYERLGFVEIARRSRYYSGAVAAVVMQLDLGVAEEGARRDVSALSRGLSCPLEGGLVPPRGEGQQDGHAAETMLPGGAG
jgi:[ribosomal protein S18]-alanine N-acetyltransferase